MAPTIGYSLSSEELSPADLVRYAALAEEKGFPYAIVSDHFHPWTDRQGESPFVWAVLGAIAEATGDLRVGTGVTCPTMRIHPAIVAQAVATTASLFEGRFFLGVGTGENLNEHILGDDWPEGSVRLEMLEEAIEVMRALWTGEQTSHYGDHYVVRQARLYSLPDEPPDVYVAAAYSGAAQLAGANDGLISTAPEKELVQEFEKAGGSGKPRYGQMTVCWAKDEAEARKTAHEWWPNAALGGDLGQELPLPKHFEQAAQNVREEDVAEKVICGPDPEAHLQQIREFADAGFDHVYVHQVGLDQEGFLDFYAREILPKV